MALLVVFLLFAIFTLNVVLGALGIGSFLNDVQEMLTLFATAIAFVVAILKKEASAE